MSEPLHDFRPRELPPAWEWATVGELASSIDYGHTASSQDTQVGPRFLRITDITPAGVDWSTVPGCEISPSDAERCRLCPDDLLFARIGATVGKSYLIRECPEAVFASYLIRVRLNKPLFPSYLFAFFQSNEYWRQINEVQQGIGRPVVNGTKLATMHVPVPPLAEQERIADRLDELFTDLSAGTAALERVKKKLKRCRSAVLYAAVAGRLTSGDKRTWMQSPNWRNIGDVFEGLEQGWSPKCLREAASDPEQWAVMTTTAIQPMHFDGKENKVLPKELRPREDLELKVGEILITRAGPRSRAGIACLVRETRPRLILCDKAYRFRCKPDLAIGGYIEIALNARPITDAINVMKTGSSDSGLNLTQSRFRQLSIPLPPIPEQFAIVEAVNEKLSQIDAMESEVERGLARAARLRQAILKAAFAGKLVPQDASDEPAAVLLERIKKESDVAAPKNKPPTRRRKKTHEPVER